MSAKTVRVRVTVFVGADQHNPKSTLPYIHSIELLSGEISGIYGFSSEHQAIRLHKDLVALPVISGIIKSLKARGQIHRGVVILPKQVQKLYFDNEGNIRFNDEYLEEVEELKKPRLPPS